MNQYIQGVYTTIQNFLKQFEVFENQKESNRARSHKRNGAFELKKKLNLSGFVDIQCS